MQNLIFTNNVLESLTDRINALNPDKVFCLTDRNTRAIGRGLLPGVVHIAIEAGDAHKDLQSVEQVWSAMSLGGATRRSLLVNVGGGMVTDLGGFAAACFKRGIRFINVPTTLLGAVDAAVGGKTGINFLHLKNEIGAFCEADTVIISTCFFASLPPEELRSGFAEMLKHALISGQETYNRLLAFDIVGADLDRLLPLLEESVRVKRRIVAEDPHEQGIRRALNLGHTAGHAFESFALERNAPVPHGFAVAHGLLVEMIISHLTLQFPSDELYRYAGLLRDAYSPALQISCKDYPALLNLMRHDKKNRSASEINFTLLCAPGRPMIDRVVNPETIEAALDLYVDLCL